jgi:hypothetical protein
MKSIIRVGTYQLGQRPAELFIDTSHDAGSVVCVPDKKDGHIPLTRIVVGVKGVFLWSAWGTLVHEVMELSLSDHKTSYRLYGTFHSSTEERSFFLDHRVFTRVCDEVGNYLHECKADFDRAFRAARRKTKTKKRK